MRGKLKTLSFIGCDLGDAEAATTIADFIKSDNVVDHLSLYSTNLSLTGMCAIADALKHNQTVYLVSLTSNWSLHDQGYQMLIDALNHNACIRQVDNDATPILRATIDYLTQTRNGILIPAAARRAALCLIAIRRGPGNERMGDFAKFPREIVQMIAVNVYATRTDPIWIETVSNDEERPSNSNT